MGEIKHPIIRHSKYITKSFSRLTFTKKKKKCMKVYIRFGAQDLNGQTTITATNSYDLDGMDMVYYHQVNLVRWGGGTHTSCKNIGLYD
jgi:hypothetical protein